METGVITNFISTVGFPIMCCIGMAYFINTTMKDFTKTMSDNSKVLEKLISKLENDERM